MLANLYNVTHGKMNMSNSHFKNCFSKNIFHRIYMKLKGKTSHIDSILQIYRLL